MLIAAVAAHAAMAAIGLVAFSHYASPRILGILPASAVLHGSLGFSPWPAEALLGFAVVNIACGLLALVPIPPLELGIVVWGRMPRSPGARRLAYRLLEEQWGVAAVLLLLLLPLAGQQPVLLSVIDSVTKAIFGG
jgi:hypothetical protein